MKLKSYKIGWCRIRFLCLALFYEVLVASLRRTFRARFLDVKDCRYGRSGMQHCNNCNLKKKRFLLAALGNPTVTRSCVNCSKTSHHQLLIRQQKCILCYKRQSFNKKPIHGT